MQLLQDWTLFRDLWYLLQTGWFITGCSSPGCCSLVWVQLLHTCLGRTAAVTGRWQLWRDPGAAPGPAVGPGWPMLGRRVCTIQASVTDLLPPVLQWGQSYYGTYRNKVKKRSPKKSAKSPCLTAWADFINLSLLFFPVLAAGLFSYVQLFRKWCDAQAM